MILKRKDFIYEDNKLKTGSIVKTNFPDADFWVIRKGSINNVGKPVKEYSPEHVGIKCGDDLDAKYAYYMMQHMHNRNAYSSEILGMGDLKHIRTDVIKRIILGE